MAKISHTSWCATGGNCWCRQETTNEPIQESVSSSGTQQEEVAEGRLGTSSTTVRIEERPDTQTREADNRVEEYPDGGLLPTRSREDDGTDSSPDSQVQPATERATVVQGCRVEVRWQTSRYVYEDLKGKTGEVREVNEETNQAWVMLDEAKRMSLLPIEGLTRLPD